MNVIKGRKIVTKGLKIVTKGRKKVNTMTDGTKCVSNISIVSEVCLEC